MGLTSHRQAYYRVSVVGSDGLVKTVLPTVVDGSIHLNALSKLKSSGEITVVADRPPVTLGDRVRVDYVHDEGEWAVGTFWASTPSERVFETHREYSIELLGTLAFLDEDCVDAAYSVPAGVNIVDRVVEIIRSAGVSQVAAVPSVERTLTSLVWDAGTSKLRIVNDLLDSINYWSVFTDAHGVFQVAPYLRPVRRAVAWRFQEGAESVHLAEWEREQDTASVPNKVVVVSNPPADMKPAFVGVATNLNADSPYSYPSRGRWITHVEQNVEVASQQAVDEIARRKLIGLSTPQASLRISHAPVPVGVSQVVEFTSQGFSGLCVVMEMEYRLDATGLVESRLVEVVDL